MRVHYRYMFICWSSITISWWKFTHHRFSFHECIATNRYWHGVAKVYRSTGGCDEGLKRVQVHLMARTTQNISVEEGRHPFEKQLAIYSFSLSLSLSSLSLSLSLSLYVYSHLSISLAWSLYGNPKWNLLCLSIRYWILFTCLTRAISWCRAFWKKREMRLCPISSSLENVFKIDNSLCAFSSLRRGEERVVVSSFYFSLKYFGRFCCWFTHPSTDTHSGTCQPVSKWRRHVKDGGCEPVTG